MKGKLIITIAAAALLFGSAASADYDISVRMDSVIGEGSEYVDFGGIKPVQLESRTLTPARNMAEAAGMIVTWDQPTQTAVLTLAANAYSDKNIERYAAKLINSVEAPAPGLEPVDITAALKLDSSAAVIRFNYIDSEGDYVAVGTEYEMVSKAILIDNGTLMIPLRDSMEMFGLNVGWNQDSLCAYVSVPETSATPENLRIIANPGEGEYAPTDDNLREYTSYSYEDLMNGGDGLTFAYEDYSDDEHSGDEYLGVFKITHYCPCSICNGSWGDGTAWAGKIIPGQTIGVNPNVIAPLSWVYIDGYGMRRAEDTGSGIGTQHIDVAVATHDEVLRRGVVYKDVYLVKDYKGE